MDAIIEDIQAARMAGFALRLTGCLFVSGVAWVWAAPVLRRRQPGWVRAVVFSTFAALTGTAITLLLNVLLRSGWRISHGVLCGATGAVAAAGVATGLWRKRPVWRRAAWCLPGAACFAVACWGVMMLPDRGEWILGGWDPGIYVNQGAAVARTDTFDGPKLASYAALNESEFRAFTRGSPRYRECFPGVPIDDETMRIRHYFFRVTPAFISLLIETGGGLRAATRVNHIAGLLAATAFFTCLLVHTKALSQAVFALALLVTHPLWLYHLNLPVSEMLQLALVFGIGALIRLDRRSTWGTVSVGLLLAAGILNRFSFAPFAGLLLCLLVWLDAPCPARRRVMLRHVGYACAIVLAVTFDLVACRITMVRLRQLTPALLGVTGLCIGLALAVDGLTWNRKMQVLLGKLPPWSVLTAGALALLIALVGFDFAGKTSFDSLLAGIRSLLPFVGGALTGLAAIGMVFAFGTRERLPKGFAAFVTFLLLVTGLLLVQGFITNLYPWATRRYLVYTVPALAILAGHVLALLWRRQTGVLLWRGVSVVVLMVLIGSNAKRSWHAWNRTEYNGVSRVLAQVADQIDSRDILVVDHPWWGTPLALTYGKAVLNARPFYAAGDESVMQSGLNALRRLQHNGYRIRFLTSTDRGLEVYPSTVGRTTLDWASPPLKLWETIHSARATDFEMRPKHHEFRLYTWCPPTEADS